MNFNGVIVVQYYMKKFLPYIKPIICMLICTAVCIAFLCMALIKNRESVQAEEQAVLNIWQIDSFEGGKGSRADFLKKVGEDFSKNEGCFVSVVALSAEAARLNLTKGTAPDLISYGAGIYGIESYIGSYKSWCNGVYCFLTTDTNSDFSDITVENTVINEGKDNLAGLAALTCGLNGADFEKSTGAYVKLINGKYKYLLGTQRDVYRLKTRGASFAVKPITEFNDLYQNISIILGSNNAKYAEKFVDFLLTVSANVTKLGMFAEGAVYDDEMKVMQGLTYEYKLTAPVSEQTRKQLENIITSGDINMLKNLLK